jgi:hypothetical protein
MGDCRKVLSRFASLKFLIQQKHERKYSSEKKTYMPHARWGGSWIERAGELYSKSVLSASNSIPMILREVVEDESLVLARNYNCSLSE